VHGRVRADGRMKRPAEESIEVEDVASQEIQLAETTNEDETQSSPRV